MSVSLLQPCPCGTGDTFARCCSPLLAGRQGAATAEQLMRSRYVAHVTGNRAHLERTWHPRTRPADLELDATIRWTGLTISRTLRGGEDDPEGIVAFRATHLVRGAAEELREESLFQRLDGDWVYVGEVRRGPRRGAPVT